MFARAYGHLAGAPEADVIASVTHARAVVQRELRQSPDQREQRLADLDEWALLSVLSAAGQVPLIDPALPALDVAAPAVGGHGAEQPRSAPA